MKRTTVSFEGPTLKRLRRAAAERDASIAELLREALEEKPEGIRPKLRSLGMADSGYSETGRNAGEILPEPPDWRS